jgi:hypothetical protein
MVANPYGAKQYFSIHKNALTSKNIFQYFHASVTDKVKVYSTEVKQDR